MKAEVVIKLIHKAFEERKLPEDDPVFSSYSHEIEDRKMQDLAHRVPWVNIPHNIICDNPGALAYMTPHAFAYFLPAYLIISVTRFAETDTLSMSIITNVTLPNEEDADEFEELLEDLKTIDPDLADEIETPTFRVDNTIKKEYQERIDTLSMEEKIAVKEWLQFIHDVYGSYFPAFGPKQALDRFWSQFTNAK